MWSVISAEIFYKEDFEVESLVPALIASVVGYSIVGAATGFQPVFTPPLQATEFDHPWSLILFALLGVGCALLARLLFMVFFRIEKFFKRFPLWVATALGGFCAGIVGLVIPSVIGTGYGWAQFAISQNAAMLPPLMMLAPAAAEIVGASLTLGPAIREASSFLRGDGRDVRRRVWLRRGVAVSIGGDASGQLRHRGNDRFFCRRRQSADFHDHHDPQR